MARQCELTGVKPLTGNNVSHSNRKTKRRFAPNLVRATLHSDVLGRDIRFRIAARALRSVDKLGGLDGFLQRADDARLSMPARRAKREIARRLAIGDGSTASDQAEAAAG